jgi:hypothetical protein
MPRNTALVSGVVVSVVLAGLVVAPATRAEVSINAQGREIYVHADPGSLWAPHRAGVSSRHVLNPFGDARGDGLPAIAQNPVTGAWEVAWGRAGRTPGVAFADFDIAEDAWVTRDVWPAAGVDAWAGRSVTFVHDDWGNRYIGYVDTSSGHVLLASAPRDSHEINRPMVVSQDGVRGSAPALYWDGDVLVIAYARERGGLDVVNLLPLVDDEGRIPNAGIGIPGIPDLDYTLECVPGRMRPSSLAPPVIWPGPGSGGGAGGGADEDPEPTEDVQPLVRIEAAWGDRLLVTWIASGSELGYAVRVGTVWSYSGVVPLEEPFEHERARLEAFRLVTGRGRSPGR